jgi:predicted Zn-dependent protease
VHRYARCMSYPEWGVGTVAGIYFSGNPDAPGAEAATARGDGEGVDGGEAGLQWARVRFSHGVRTVPAGSMRFVDFSKPDPAAERVERFMIAAQRAMAEGEYELAAQRLVYARDAEPRNVKVLRQMTLAFWQAGNLEAAARSVRDWARVDGSRPAPHRFAARIYEDIGAFDLAEEAAGRAVERGPADAGGWERLGRLRLRLRDREGALKALERAISLGAGEDVRDLMMQALALEPSAAPVTSA